MDVANTCEVCGYTSNLGAVAKHYPIPKSVTEQADTPDYVTVSLCCNCHFELNTWYKMKVLDMVYDAGTKKISDVSWDKKVKEYNAAFRNFKKYIDEQRKRSEI